jgi:hypothetical protein
VVESPSKEPQSQESPAREDGATSGPVPTDDALTGQLRRTSELIAAQRLPEAEAILLAARRSSGHDLRVLKLLALVRFKLGRFAEARDVYRQAAGLAPEDATLRLNLGLIALKLDAFAEAAEELEAAVRLEPDDRRAWSYLGYAYARNAAPAQAATAFRRAGQHELAAEMERTATPLSHAVDAAVVEGLPPSGPTTSDPAVSVSSGMATPRPIPHNEKTPVPVLRTEAATVEPVATLAAFATGHLLPFVPSGAPMEMLGRGVLRFAAGSETHVRESALLVALGGDGLVLARRRVRGHLSSQQLVQDADRFLRVEGSAEVLLASPDNQRRLIALSLDRDVLYVEEVRVVAWGDEIVWESGSVPGDGTALLQFRGTGRVVILAGEEELVAIRIAEGESMVVPSQRLAGWLGRVVVQARPTTDSTGLHHVNCEGEGVLLISKHGESR